MAMAEAGTKSIDIDIELMVKERVEDELKTITFNKRGREMNKTVKDFIEIVMPEITKVISVAVSAAVSGAMTKVMERLDTIHKRADQTQNQVLVNNYDCDKIEQYQRRDNIRIFGLEEEEGETEEDLELKVIELASEMGVSLKADEISIAHRLGRSRNKERQVIVRFCHRKKRNEIMRKKAELKKKSKKVFINEDLTPIRVAMLKMVKEQQGIKNAISRGGKIVAWREDQPGRAIEMDNPGDLCKVGIDSANWQRLKMPKMALNNLE